MQDSQLSNVQIRNLFGGTIPTAQVLQGVASGLAGVGVRVEISPKITVPSADTTRKVIYLPSTVRSKKALIVVKMLINHEGGHILYTPTNIVAMIDGVVNHGDIYKYVTEKMEMDKVPQPLWNYAKSFWNCVEDPRIEKLMIAEFPGCKHHFIGGTIAGGFETLVTDIMKEHKKKLKEAEDAGVPEKELPKMNPFWLAEWHAFHRVGGSHGQQSLDHVREETPEGYEEIFEIVDRNIADVEEDITKAESVDLVRIADKTIAEIMEYLKLEKPPEGSGGGGQGESQEGQEGKPGEGGSSGPSAEIDPNQPPSKSKGQMGDEDEQGKGSSGERDQDDGESGEGSDGGNEGSSGNNSGKGKGAEGDEDADEESGGSGKGDADDDKDSSGQGGDDGSGDDDSEGESGESSEGDSEDDNSNSGHDEHTGEGEDAEADDVGNESDGKGNPKWDQAIEWLKEAETDMAEEIRKNMEEEERKEQETTEGSETPGGQGGPGSGSPAKYVGPPGLENMPHEYLDKIFPGLRVIVVGSQDISKVLEGTKGAAFDEYNQGIRELMPKNLGAASKKLMGEFRAKFGPADKGQRLNPRMFTAIKAGRWQGKKVMLSRNKTRLSKRGVCVQLVIDCSGSMVESISGLQMGKFNSKFAVAHATARGLSRLLQSVGISFEVVGFSTAYNNDLGKAPGANGATGMYSYDYSRNVDIVNYVFKEFQAPWAVSEKSMLAINPRTDFNMPDGTNLCPHTNSDGESILWAATRIIGRKEEKKIMIVLSDGLPYAGNNRLQSDFLRWAVARIANAGIHIGGLGLGSNGVAQYYNNNEVIDSFPAGKGEKHSAPLFIQNKIISLINKMSHE